jgi:Tol biopolymer transport system component
MDLEGGHLKQLTDGQKDESPVILPDGGRVVFIRGQAGRYVLMKLPSGGGPLLIDLP